MLSVQSANSSYNRNTYNCKEIISISIFLAIFIFTSFNVISKKGKIMQVSKITLTNFKGGKLPQAVKKTVKPAVEEIKPDFNVYAYGVPTGDIPLANKAEKAAKELPVSYYPYATPIKKIENNAENNAAKVKDIADKEDKIHEYLSASMPL